MRMPSWLARLKRRVSARSAAPTGYRRADGTCAGEVAREHDGVRTGFGASAFIQDEVRQHRYDS